MYNNYYPYYGNFKNNYRKINFKNLLDGTQKTLSIINQAIPIIYQIKPLYENAKTAFRVMNAIKDTDKVTINQTKKVESSKNNPTYFL